MSLNLLFVAADPFFVVAVFREIDVELVFSSHRVGGVGSSRVESVRVVYNVNTIMFILYNKSRTVGFHHVYRSYAS